MTGRRSLHRRAGLPAFVRSPRERQELLVAHAIVAGLQLAISVALAVSALQTYRMWRQGIPYSTLMLNAINHPDARGMSLFADSLMALFPGRADGAESLRHAMCGHC